MTDVRVLLGDCIDLMQAIDAESIDAIVCDPPYGLEFMGKDWDSFRRDDPGTGRHRGKHAGQHGEIHDANALNDGRPSRVGVGGGKRPTTSRCTGCGIRDQFRKEHECAPSARWATEILDPYAAPPTMLAFQEWCRTWGLVAYRILKPGGHVLAFGGTRTYHRLASGLEDAGFEVRDSLHWIYGSGFPKSLDVSKQIDKQAGVERTEGAREWQGGERSGGIVKDAEDEVTSTRTIYDTPATEDAKRWDGWGTALKPAHEPIILARKPLSGTVAETVLAHGTGAVNIAATRVGADGGTRDTPNGQGIRTNEVYGEYGACATDKIDAGRWPANLLLAHLPECEGSGATNTDVLCAPGCPVAELNEASGESKSTGGTGTVGAFSDGEIYGAGRGSEVIPGDPGFGDSGGAARFFYIAKPRKRERVGGTVRNLHPTVKPIDLMRHLVRLVTPPGGTVLDPFLGSGSTGCAAMVEGFRFVGIEQDPDSYETALARIADYAFAHGRERPVKELSPPASGTTRGNRTGGPNVTDEEQGGQAAQEEAPEVAVEGDHAHVEVNPSEGNQGETAAEQEARLAEGSASTGASAQPTEAEASAPGAIPPEGAPSGEFEETPPADPDGA